MHNHPSLLTLIAGAALFAAFAFALLSAPGFLSDRDSTVPVHGVSWEARR